MKGTGKKWWKAAGIRAMKTVAQTAIGCIGASAVLSDVNWAVVASAAVLSGVVSLLTSVAGLPGGGSRRQRKKAVASSQGG